MANDTDTILNPGIGGDRMDESLVTRPDTSQAKRPRVVLGGDSYDSGLAEPLSSPPVGTEAALPVRQVGKLQVEGVVGGVPLPVDVTIGDTLTADQGAPALDANSWPVHQVGTPPLPAGAATQATLAAAAVSLASIDGEIDTALSTRASEATLSGAAASLASIDTDIDVALSTRASEASLVSGVTAILAALAPKATEATLAAIDSDIDVALSTRASEATLAAAAASVAAIDADIDVALSTRASEATLSAAAASLASIDADLDVALSTRASEATLAAANGHLAAIDANVDVALSTRASEATLLAAAASLASIDTDIDTALSTRATAAAQTDGTQKAIARGGSKGATTAADVTSTSEGADHQALDVQIYHGGTAKDPTQIRALTAADVVTAQQGTSPWVEDLSRVGGSAVATIAAGELRVGAEGVSADGAVLTGNPVRVGASDGANLQTPRVFDVDTGVGTQFALGVSLRKAASGGSVEAGTSADPLRVDPTGTTAQPVTDNAGSLTVDTPQLPAALVGGRLDENIGAWLGSTAPTVGQKASASSIPVVVASDQSNLPSNLTQVAGSAVTTQAAGELLVATEGRAASGAAVAGNPVLSGGSDGTNARIFLTDTSGRQQMVGAAADGAAVAGNPILVGGQDGTNAQSLLTDTSGRPNVVGAAAQGAAVTGNPLLVAGEDGAGNVARLQARTAPAVGAVVGQVVRQVVSQTCITTRPATSTANATILAANTARLGAIITNDSNHALYVKCGATASATSYTKILDPGADWQVPFGYTGIIDAILSAGTGNAQVGEYT